MNKWIDGKGKDEEIVISSRIRLARNLDNIKFPHLATSEEAQKVIELTKKAIFEDDTSLAKEFEIHRVGEIPLLDRKILVEKHLISRSLLEKPEASAFLLRKDEKVTIMLNEEDHIRIQVLMTGLNLEEGWDICNSIDDVLEENVKYAFDERVGYLTSCPTNVGTGLRASVMIHLPCLVLTGYINKVLQAVNQIGLTVRGLYGEGTEAMGNIFQISNQTTLGETEEEIIQKLKNIVLQIIYKERDSRNKLMISKRIEIEDKIYRSLGVLQNSRIMTSKESMKLLSDVRMGIEMGIIEDIEIDTVNSLMISTQPANIQKNLPEEMTIQERDMKRSEIIREKFRS